MSVSRGPMWRIDVVGVVACVGVSGAWYALGVRPLASAQAARTGVVDEIQARQERAEKVARTARTVGAQAEAAQKPGGGQTMLLPVEQMNRRVAELNEAAASGSLRLDALKPGAPWTGARHTSVPIVLSGSGSYAAAAAFLHRLRTEFADVGVTGFDLRANTTDPSASQFVFNLVWYAAPGASGTKK
ncbi:MAG: hypothetical protein ACKVW3_06580 [Phycisphaerales bacterium]